MDDPYDFPLMLHVPTLVMPSGGIACGIAWCSYAAQTYKHARNMTREEDGLFNRTQQLVSSPFYEVTYGPVYN